MRAAVLDVTPETEEETVEQAAVTEEDAPEAPAGARSRAGRRR